jgi:hypothetical protein
MGLVGLKLADEVRHSHNFARKSSRQVHNVRRLLSNFHPTLAIFMADGPDRIV